MNILLVDDDDHIRKIVHLALERVGRFTAVSAASAAQGIELAKTHAPDLILMDMMMPGMDGLRALEELRRIPSLAAIPVIFMTAKVQREEIQHYMAAGAAGVILKPFDPMTLPDEIRSILAGMSRAAFLSS